MYFQAKNVIKTSTSTVVKLRFTVSFAAVLCFVTQCSSLRLALRDDTKNWLRGEFINFLCFSLSAFARHQSIPPHAEKNVVPRAVNLQIAINISRQRVRRSGN